MKKVFAMIIIFILMAGNAFAAKPDLSDLSEDELLEVIHEAQAILFASNLVEGVSVPAGKYIIGEDIPAGVYRIEFIGGDFASGRLFVYDKNGTPETIHLVGKGESVPEIGKIELIDGQTIEILYISSVFYTYTGLFH